MAKIAITLIDRFECLVSPTIVELRAKIGVKWCREAATSGQKSTQNAVVSCRDWRIGYRCFSSRYSRRRLAVLFDSHRCQMARVVGALQKRSSGTIQRDRQIEAH
ncbi:MAG: hypothetical protein WCA20_07050 [Candidatus Sulfotelmatobacter sp.]